ncbi:hypothetical protein EIK77_004196 [Talaromyces pinophilus]|nr:hypothetical protein EIK77_004196 [Talaromyces pinophilus]
MGRRIYTCTSSSSLFKFVCARLLIDAGYRIVGKGNHSAYHVQKIKPRVEQVCRELGLQYATEENAGRIYINLTGGPAEMPPYQQHQQQQPHYGGGGGYPGQQPQQQQYGQQYGQQQGKQDDIEAIVEKVLPRVLRKLGDCCIVM